jgi:hypothetical protein
MDDLISEYACKASCAGCGRFAETLDWGLGSETFREVVNVNGTLV